MTGGQCAGAKPVTLCNRCGEAVCAHSEEERNVVVVARCYPHTEDEPRYTMAQILEWARDVELEIEDMGLYAVLTHPDIGLAAFAKKEKK